MDSVDLKDVKVGDRLRVSLDVTAINLLSFMPGFLARLKDGGTLWFDDKTLASVERHQACVGDRVKRLTASGEDFEYSLIHIRDDHGVITRGEGVEMRAFPVLLSELRRVG